MQTPSHTHLFGVGMCKKAFENLFPDRDLACIESIGGMSTPVPLEGLTVGYVRDLYLLEFPLGHEYKRLVNCDLGFSKGLDYAELEFVLSNVVDVVSEEFGARFHTLYVVPREVAYMLYTLRRFNISEVLGRGADPSAISSDVVYLAEVPSTRELILFREAVCGSTGGFVQGYVFLKVGRILEQLGEEVPDLVEFRRSRTGVTYAKINKEKLKRWLSDFSLRPRSREALAHIPPALRELVPKGSGPVIIRTPTCLVCVRRRRFRAYAPYYWSGTTEKVVFVTAKDVFWRVKGEGATNPEFWKIVWELAKRVGSAETISGERLGHNVRLECVRVDSWLWVMLLWTFGLLVLEGKVSPEDVDVERFRKAVGVLRRKLDKLGDRVRGSWEEVLVESAEESGDLAKMLEDLL